MKNLVKILFTTSLLLAATLTGCSNKEWEPAKYDDDNLSFRLKLPIPTVQTRAEDQGTADERKIQTLHAYFFNGANLIFSSEITVPSTSKEEQLLFLPVAKAQQNLFDGNHSYDVYFVANANKLDVTTLDAFKSTIINTKPDGSAGSFVMTGMLSGVSPKINAASRNLGLVSMKRLAVKIEVGVTGFVLSGYRIQGNIKFTLKNSTTKSYLSKEETLPEFMETEDVSQLKPLAANATFYSYANYRNSEDNSTYIDLTVPIQKMNSADTQIYNYFYRAYLSGEQTNLVLNPNHLYRVRITVIKLGSLDPEQPSMDVCIQFEKVETTSGVVSTVTVNKAHYLVISENKAEMKNINSYLIDYNTSDEVEIRDVKAFSKYVDANGIEQTPPATGDQIPTVELTADHKIRITSKVPVNSVPKIITFKLAHKTYFGIDPIEVEIKQYPGEFITSTWGTKSSSQPDGNLAPHLNNKAIYNVVSLVPDGKHILGFPPKTRIKFYKTQGSGTVVLTEDVVVDNEETANMVSPSFELASQLGASIPMPYQVKDAQGHYIARGSGDTNINALFYCADYWEERMENGQPVKLKDWRLPTKAEILLIEKLQKDPQSAVKSIMTGLYYWSNLSFPAVKLNNPTSGSSTTSAHTRCIRDVK
ncbi:fimbrial protein [Porphyromonas sp.]|uniref:fimbrial tip adhesin FimD n=1 Tax=Porphyromonas sp. TaxID=1924944 RepID=UPI0026DA6E97|nr:fimbrial protein [Porphyromonas sp.]MDO4770316.1 fimbrial protein [Porphyromonas sp.]